MRTAMLEQRLAALGPPGPDLKESFKKIPMRDGFESELKIFQPTQKPAGGSPLIIMCFGGGTSLSLIQTLIHPFTHTQQVSSSARTSN